MKMRNKILILVTLISVCVQAQHIDNSGIALQTLSRNEIPSQIKIKGNLLIAKKWQDQNGENILIVSRKGPLKEIPHEFEFSGDERYAELFGEQYIKKADNYVLLWNIYDFERHCPFDLYIGLLPNSTSITDLDSNGITETTLIYKLTCRSDISPSRMKILMHENSVKMGLRGIMAMRGNDKQIEADFEPNLSKIDTTGLNELEQRIELYGRYENENDFKGKPVEFLEFAKSQWTEFIEKDEFEQF